MLPSEVRVQTNMPTFGNPPEYGETRQTGWPFRVVKPTNEFHRLVLSSSNRNSLICNAGIGLIALATVVVVSERIIRARKTDSEMLDFDRSIR